MDYLLPAHCRADIFEVESRQEWVDCAKLRAFHGFAWSLGILVVIVILLLFAWGSPTLLFFAVLFGILVIVSGVNYAFLAEWQAGGDYDTLQYERSRIKKINPSFNDGAVDEVIRKERFEKMQAQSRRDAANTTASATNAQTAALLSMFARRDGK